MDYLQLQHSDESWSGRENRVQEISFISRTLKGLARELNVPVIALAQLSRDSGVSMRTIQRVAAGDPTRGQTTMKLARHTSVSVQDLIKGHR